MMTSVGKNTIAGELLRSHVERVENINAQIKQLNQDKAVVLAEAMAELNIARATALKEVAA